jgi:hypothetical protein
MQPLVPAVPTEQPSMERNVYPAPTVPTTSVLTATASTVQLTAPYAQSLAALPASRASSQFPRSLDSARTYVEMDLWLIFRVMAAQASPTTAVQRIAPSNHTTPAQIPLFPTRTRTRLLLSALPSAPTTGPLPSPSARLPSRSSPITSH